ncbi:HIT family protein [Pseudomonas rubra]|uniref:HIT family protein n=1 Tax=Pseudomonas rubra TaxID=2942627 RepID=A0ABT5PA71_9PSED|nr:HIT family protein [Pseudomonas rubra]MDD1015081.1 HIT family protein [Pseudomonas rubra]MDD1038584.1 HIT family protein [Pseudomonas rubra]MDD1154724.1 HIT family protein [Pseudomonas rubra]
MEIPSSHIIQQTEHWVLNHHLASALPGYLMLGPTCGASSLADLAPAALAELGGLLASTQRVMEAMLEPKWLYISRYGHMPGLPLHFHFIPVYPWVEALFWQDERYRLLQAFAGTDCPATATDGAELTLFIWREFGESPTPPAVEGPSVGQVIERLRRAF